MEQWPQLSPERHVALVGPTLEASADLCAAARAEGLRVTALTVPDAAAALAADPTIVAVLVDARGLSEELAGVVAALGDDPPPVVLLAGSPLDAGGLDAAVVAPADGPAILAQVDRCARASLYEGAVVAAFDDGARAVLATGFGTTATTGRIFLKTQPRLLGPIASVVRFTRGTQGWVCVAAEQPALEGVLSRAVPGVPSSRQVLQDLAGELANHFAARVRNGITGASGSSSSTPVPLTADHVGLLPDHSVVVELVFAEGSLFAQLHVDQSVQIRPPPLGATGTFQFL